jgi:hypothetical protein
MTLSMKLEHLNLAESEFAMLRRSGQALALVANVEVLG